MHPKQMKDLYIHIYCATTVGAGHIPFLSGCIYCVFQLFKLGMCSNIGVVKGPDNIQLG